MAPSVEAGHRAQNRVIVSRDFATEPFVLWPLLSLPPQSVPLPRSGVGTLMAGLFLATSSAFTTMTSGRMCCL